MKMILIGLAIRLIIEIILLVIKRKNKVVNENAGGVVMHPAEFGLREV